MCIFSPSRPSRCSLNNIVTTSSVSTISADSFSSLYTMKSPHISSSDNNTNSSNTPTCTSAIGTVLPSDRLSIRDLIDKYPIKKNKNYNDSKNTTHSLDSNKVPNDSSRNSFERNKFSPLSVSGYSIHSVTPLTSTQRKYLQV